VIRRGRSIRGGGADREGRYSSGDNFKKRGKREKDTPFAERRWGGATQTTLKCRYWGDWGVSGGGSGQCDRPEKKPGGGRRARWKDKKNFMVSEL